MAARNALFYQRFLEVATTFMQVTELFRRGVVRPFDERGASQLRSFWISSSIRVEWLPILDDHQFDAIWESGIFQAINAACGVCISDYEETILELSQLEAAVALFAANPSLTYVENVQFFYQSLAQLFLDAFETQLPVLFVL